MASTIDRNHGWRRSCTIKANIVRTLRHEHRVTLPYLYEKWCKIYFGISHWPCDGYFWIRGHTLVYHTSGLLHWEITSSMEIMTRNFTIAFGHTQSYKALFFNINKVLQYRGNSRREESLLNHSHIGALNKPHKHHKQITLNKYHTHSNISYSSIL